MRGIHHPISGALYERDCEVVGVFAILVTDYYRR